MRFIVGGLLIVALSGGMVVSTRAGDKEEGYVSLFNGKDLAGWKYGKEADLTGKTETADKRFRVADGVIICEEGKGIKDLYTVKSYNGEFNLKLQFRAAPKADSGVYIRGQQLQVRDYPTVGPYKKVKFKDADWNDLDITVKNGVASSVVNGKTLTEKDALEVTFKDGKPAAKLNGKEVDITKIEVSIGAVARCLCNGEFIENMKVPQKAGQGIGLQAEVGKFEFRNIRVKEVK